MIFLHSIWPRVKHWQITACVHVAIKLIYQDHNVSSSKNQKYNFGKAVVQEALSNQFSIPTPKEYICKKCDKHLLVEKMPTNSVESWMRLTSHKPQQKCIHCNSVPTDKFLTFDKTKYGENSIVSQMNTKWWTKDYM